jgi:hypothetical protein
MWTPDPASQNNADLDPQSWFKGSLFKRTREGMTGAYTDRKENKILPYIVDVPQKAAYAPRFLRPSSQEGRRQLFCGASTI